MGTVLFSSANTVVATASLRALLAGLLIMLVILPALSLLAHNKQAKKALFFILFSSILICSSVIFAASLAHTNYRHDQPGTIRNTLWD